ncbi:hypothetical protein GCM10023219_01660 [Stakelama sediminis]|uniref:Integron n=1 Tax=Stakelama sediminis TaxID=463200 RepID=A0A840Z102_9SPHN|nr:hypothetical protein [Stakelama sediminis]MBB5719396.1 hypothetical protein [Stakelama sediminis]
MRILFPALLLLLSACNNVQPIGNDTDTVQGNFADTTLSPGTRPIRIGENGPGFAACAINGTVATLPDNGTLPLRTAPFSDAKQIAVLQPGRKLFICTRSMDQRWLGVVVRPATGEPDQDCGVSARLDSPRDYAGPCASGWVANAFVQFTAD